MISFEKSTLAAGRRADTGGMGVPREEPGVTREPREGRGVLLRDTRRAGGGVGKLGCCWDWRRMELVRELEFMRVLGALKSWRAGPGEANIFGVEAE